MAGNDDEDYSWGWLESTRRLQTESFGVDYGELTGETLADYVIYNALALVVEVGELMDEFRWKPWASPRGSYDREAALKELVDVAHFMANIAAAIGISDEEWEAAYRQKQDVNSRRQRDGYDGVSTKCSGCGRALDDVGRTYREGSEQVTYCTGCGRSNVR